MRFARSGCAAFVVAVIAAAPARAQDRVIGLLTLPEVFGEVVCVPFEPRPVTLFAEPAGAAVATLETVVHLPPPPAGPCITVSVVRGGTKGELPANEYAYEMSPAAIVLDRRAGWFKIRASDGASWVAPSPRHQFLPLEKLLIDRDFAATTKGFSGQLRHDPGGEAFGEPLKEFQALVVKDVRRLRGREWLHVELLSHSPCDGNINIEPFAIAKGWLAAHHADGEPAVWFYSRGC